MKQSDNIKEISKQVWGASPAGTTYAKGYTKGTKEFFDAVILQRSTEECPWLDEIVQFSRFKNKKVLEVGCGAGYDAYAFCKAGADYTGIDITPDNPVIAKKHLSFYGFHAHIKEADIEHFTGTNEYDFVYSFGVMHHVPDIEIALKNINRALKLHGEAQIIVYHKRSIFYWLHIVLFDWVLRGKFLKMSLEERVSLIEYTTSSVNPLVRVYTKKSLNSLLVSAGFEIVENQIRKLTYADLPNIWLINKLYSYIPQRWLDAVGRYFGWYISARAIKIKDL